MTPANQIMLAAALIPAALAAQSPVPSAERPTILAIGQAVQRPLPIRTSHVYAVPVIAGQRYRALLGPHGVHIWLRANAADSASIGVIMEGGDTVRSLEIVPENSGTYKLEVIQAGGDSTSGSYTLRIEQIPALEAGTANLETTAATRWLKANVHPLRSVVAGKGVADLMPLKQILSGVRVVGLGEGTHGTREFFEVKHRVFEFLVREMGFTVFALETSQTAAHAINDYVLTGKGDGAKVLAEQGLWNWDTEEMGAMLYWMRAYNRTVSSAKKVRFAGFDFQYNPGARDRLRGYLTIVAPDRVASADSILTVLAESADSARPDAVRYYTASNQAKQALVRKVNELLGFLVLNRAKFSSRASVARHDSTVQLVRMLAQLADSHIRVSYEQHIAESGVATRDRYMAENVAALMASLPPGSRIVLSSHNEHVRRDAFNMGYYLGEKYGSAYYAFGLTFGQGGFQALSITGKSPAPLAAFTVGPGFPDATDWFLSRAKRGDHFVNLRRIPKTGAAGAWMSRPHQMRSIGNGYAPGNPSGYYRAPIIFGKSFDGLIFIERTTRARPNPSVRR